MHGHELYWGLHWGQRVQDQLAERAYAEVGLKSWHGKQNCGELSPGDLRRGGTYDPIRLDIYTTHHLGHRGEFTGVEKMLQETLLPCPLFRKKNPLTHYMISNYDDDQ